MKSPNTTVLCLGVLFLLATGCSTDRPVQRLGEGYQEIMHPGKTGDPADARISLEHRASDGKITLVWPSLSGVPEIIKNDVAIFVGDKTYMAPDPDAPRAARPRLFAVQEPGLPLEITDDVLAKWCRQSGKDIGTADRLLEMVTPMETNGVLQVQLEFWAGGNGWPDHGTIMLTWNQISDIMRSVKEKGTVRKDIRWHTPYLQD